MKSSDQSDNPLHSLIERIGVKYPWLDATSWKLQSETGNWDAPAASSRSRQRIGNGLADAAEPSSADAAVWAEGRFRTATASVIRTVAVIPVCGLALLSDQAEGQTSEWSSRLGPAPWAGASFEPNTRAVRLSDRRRSRQSALVIPLALPHSPHSADLGAIAIDSATPRALTLTLRQVVSPQSRRCWLPWLVSWDETRNRKPVFWRTLTVSEKSRTRDSSIAFGARISWADEPFLIYRSLAAPALRAVLGCQTKDRLLIARFTAQGQIEPLLRIER